MRNYYAYIRVSTTKQGEQGSSLTEQRDAISRFAQKIGVKVSGWYEEQETAAKRGRTVFRKMLTELKKGRAQGLLMHKIDRGARNLADWAEIASLMDLGIDVQFAHESIDLQTRGGRLSADIQAVVAADYIRNLREEVKKGIQGRLKQGLYPFAAPPGYLNAGKGAVKPIDPIQGPLIREAFEKYASGAYGLHRLRDHMSERGLRNCAGREFTVSGLSKLLSNPFYFGLIRVKGETYIGGHEPLITKAVFDAARDMAAGRLVSAKRRWGGNPYRLRRLLVCSTCNIALVGETQRGHVYYRCHSKSCPGVCLTERMVIREITKRLHFIHLGPSILDTLRSEFQKHEEGYNEITRKHRAGLSLRIEQAEARLERLTDLLIDGTLDRTAYQTKKESIDRELIGVREEVENLDQGGNSREETEDFLSHASALANFEKIGSEESANAVIKSAVSNIAVSGKDVEIQWSKSFQMLLDLGGMSSSALERHAERIWRQVVTGESGAADESTLAA